VKSSIVFIDPLLSELALSLTRGEIEVALLRHPLFSNASTILCRKLLFSTFLPRPFLLLMPLLLLQDNIHQDEWRHERLV
jgi:hypothetical protein